MNSKGYHEGKSPGIFLGTLVGEGGDNRKTVILSENMQPCHSAAFVFSVKMCLKFSNNYLY